MDEEDIIDYESSVRLKTNFELSSTVKKVYTSGKIQLCSFDGTIASSSGEALNFIDKGGFLKRQIVLEADEISSFAVRPVNSELEFVIATKSLQFKHYKDETCVRTWKGHKMPALAMAYDSTGTLIACGFSDGRIFLYDVEKGYATHSFRGHSGVVLNLKFHPDPNRMLLVSCSQDGSVRCWDLVSSECKVLKGHMGAVSDFCFVGKKEYGLVSVGRDRVVILWELRTFTQVSTTPVYEELESVVKMPVPTEGSELERQLCHAFGKKMKWDDVVAFGGVSGAPLKVFDSAQRKTWKSETPEQKHQLKFAVNQLLVDNEGRIIVVTRDQNLLFHQRGSMDSSKQIVGDLDEIVDMKCFGQDSVAVATNSADLKVWSISDNNWEIVAGHKDIVLALDISRSQKMLCSGGKDNSVRIFDMSRSPVTCVHTLEGHTDSVNCVAWGGDSFVASAGKDRTVKLWKLDVESKEGGEEEEEKSELGSVTTSNVFTCTGHTAEINAIDISPNEKMMATGGADKKITLWTLAKPLTSAPSAGKKLLGHKRGIWDVKFSPVDKVLASCSGDRSVRIWNISTGSCVRVLEGHMAAVLKVTWLTAGMQIASAASDGLVKLWSTQEGTCVATLEDESMEGKIWAMDVKEDGAQLITGSSDSALCIWTDVTKKVSLEKLKSNQLEMEQKQEMDNHVTAGRYAKALVLALALDHRKKSKEIVELICKDSADPRDALTEIVKQELSDESIDLLIQLCCDWNKHSQHAAVAQIVVEAILCACPVEKLIKSTAVKTNAESWIAFSQRHLQRVNNLLTASFVIDHCFDLMGMEAVQVNKKKRGREEEKGKQKEDDDDDDDEDEQQHKKK